MIDSAPAPLPARQLLLGTLSFAVCFAAWGLVAAFAPRFRETFHLSATETALLVAVPVLLGSLARLPVGMLADRFGGRAVFTLLMLAVAVPVWLVPAAASYRQLLGVAFCLGLAGASFPIGVGYVSRWTPAGRQGTSLGVYGLGNAGQSAAVFLGPVLAAAIGWQTVFKGAAVLLVAWGVAFALLARNAPTAPGADRPKGVSNLLRVLGREPLAWVLSLFYFLTFGGFVAFSIYLPALLRDPFGLKPADAGFRAAGFVVLATLLRPVGGWLADRIGGARVLAGVFTGILPFALLLTWPAILPFSVGALGCAALLGLGNGAVFKLVPQYFPDDTATVTGLVGAMGGLGGFFPPLLLGLCRDRLGVIWPGFVLLAATSAALAWTNRRVFLARQERHERSLPSELARPADTDRLRAGLWATFWTGLLAAAIVVGSRNLENFDPALVVYTFAIVFATWGIAYHYNVWLRKPPTRLFWRRGWQLFRERGIGRSLAQLLPLAWSHLGAQTFIRQRSALRWWMHQLLFWGCVLAALITFPLVFGWIYFASSAGDPMRYVTYLFGFPAGSFALKTPLAWLLFHGLDVAAVLVLAGIALALWRRMRDRGARAVQDFGRDLFPLIVLFAISVTGLALTVSTLWLRGSFYPFLSLLHAVTVIAALLYLPFGKFFHIFQRPAQLGVKLYQRAGEEGEGAACARCGERFASLLHADDLKQVLGELGFDYSGFSSGSWQDLCPACKRKTLAGAQLEQKEAARG
ncbi:MAG: transporter, family, nitrate/nitrite transporter [Acidobacteriota bacterium]|jgi:NNP family nitrate/nitrite transporter-like MFS transporter|nr:transporter, family, nitrate/nitrite transporter [Acidobacteriota bacterium]